MSWLVDLADLVLPVRCAGCGCAGGHPLCPECRHDLARLTPRPARPTPAPLGLPQITALAGYAGALRGCLLAYKERGRHTVGVMLGQSLADVIVGAFPSGLPSALLILPVPSTALAIRRRRYDHVRRLASAAVGSLRRRGVAADLLRPLAARPRPDSAGLSAARRLSTAQAAFRIRARPLEAARRAAAAGAVPVLVDDVVTTGATLTAAAEILGRVGLPVRRAAVLAATQRQYGYPR